MKWQLSIFFYYSYVEFCSCEMKYYQSRGSGATGIRGFSKKKKNCWPSHSRFELRQVHRPQTTPFFGLSVVCEPCAIQNVSGWVSINFFIYLFFENPRTPGGPTSLSSIIAVVQFFCSCEIKLQLYNFSAFLQNLCRVISTFPRVTLLRMHTHMLIHLFGVLWYLLHLFTTG